MEARVARASEARMKTRTQEQLHEVLLGTVTCGLGAEGLGLRKRARRNAFESNAFLRTLVLWPATGIPLPG